MAYTFEYKFSDDDLNDSLEPNKIINQYISNGLRSSSWYKNIPTYVRSSYKHYWKHWKHFAGLSLKNEISREDVEDEFFRSNVGLGRTTVKRCPGIKDLLSHSLVCKSPTEMYIEIRNGELFSSHVAAKKLATIHWHGEEQFKYGKDSTFNNFINVKLQMNISYKVNANMATMLPPTYHNPNLAIQGAHTAPGVIPKAYLNYQDLNINFFIDRSKDRDIHISPGDALCYLLFDKPVVLKHNSKLKDLRMKTKFNTNNKNLI